MSNRALINRIVCLSSLSKDLEGKLRLMDSEQEECRASDCRTLETVHQLELQVVSHACDSRRAKPLNGTLRVCDLVHKFEDGDGTRRAIHEGCFSWKGVGVRATGTMRGVTNVGTHRPPAFAEKECQLCDDSGVLEGLLVGTIRRARDPGLVGCDLRAAYRLRFDPSTEPRDSGVSGTLEGSVFCDCPDDAPRA